MIASQAVRVAPVRHVRQPRPRHTARVTRRVRAGTTWEIRTFVAVSAVIAFVFVLVIEGIRRLGIHQWVIRRLRLQGSP